MRTSALLEAWPEGTRDARQRRGPRVTAQTTVVTFEVNQTEVLVVVPVQSEAIVEGDEAFNVSLLSPIGATLGAQQREVVIIRDDD